MMDAMPPAPPADLSPPAQVRFTHDFEDYVIDSADLILIACFHCLRILPFIKP
jgi:hypothetical protein